MALAVVLTACGNYPPSPTQVTENYLYSVSEGQFANACANLTTAARAAMAASTKPHASCGQALARCVPKDAINLSQDQTQLLYSGVETTINGSRARVSVSGTEVANAIRTVTFVKQRGNWKLSSYGSGLVACVRGEVRHRPRHRHHTRHRHHPHHIHRK